MKNRLVRFLLAGIVVAGAAEIGGRALIASSDAGTLRWHDYSSEHKIAQMDDLATANVVVVGTSMAQQALVPRHLDGGADVTYNAGLNGGVPVVAERWLVEEVAPRLSPAKVIWGLGPLDVSAVYGDATLNAYETALQTKEGLPADAERTAARISALVRHRTVLRDPSELGGQKAITRRQGRVDAIQATGERGERIDFDAVPSPARAAEVRGRISPFALDRDDLAALARSAAHLEQSGIELVLVQLPVPPRFEELYPGGPEQSELVTATLEALAAELDVPLIPVSGEYGNADFVDFTHLTEASAERFSLETAAALRDLP